MVRTFAILATALLAGHGAAAQTTLASCGCDPLVMMIEADVRSDVICPDDATAEALLQTWGPVRPEGARILLIRKASGLTAWAPGGSTPEDLAREAGTVATFTGSAEERSACFGASLSCPDPRRNSHGQIQPRNGLWRSAVGEMTMTSCPVQIAAAVSAAAPAGLGEGEERRSFPDPFDPADLPVAPDAGRQAWEELPEGGWQTGFVPESIEQQQASGASSRVSMTLHVTCDTEIVGQTEILITLPEVAGALLGVGPEGCRIRRPYRLQWIGE